LDGLTCGVKDVFDIAGATTGFGNPVWARTHPPATAHAWAVERLLSRGARVVGKTISDELAFSLSGVNHHYGAPLNSAAPDRLTGGSSCGSAAAVAAGLCDFALGTDTAGSIRAPASFCGLFGFRPTHGVVSTTGVCALAPSFDVVGWCARKPGILERVGAVLLPPDQLGLESSVIHWDLEAWSIPEACDPSHRVQIAGLVSPKIRLEDGEVSEQGLDLWFDDRNSPHLASDVAHLSYGRPTLEYRGSVVNLEPDTEYEVEISIEGHPEATTGAAVTTWSEKPTIKETCLIDPAGAVLKPSGRLAAFAQASRPRRRLRGPLGPPPS